MWAFHFDKADKFCFLIQNNQYYEGYCLLNIIQGCCSFFFCFLTYQIIIWVNHYFPVNCWLICHCRSFGIIKRFDDITKKHLVRITSPTYCCLLCVLPQWIRLTINYVHYRSCLKTEVLNSSTCRKKIGNFVPSYCSSGWVWPHCWFLMGCFDVSFPIMHHLSFKIYKQSLVSIKSTKLYPF